jgi:DhnA family fructose-bisphosphate aldolase class Ia
MSEVAGATTLPILMLGGEPGDNPDSMFDRWEAAMAEPNVRGLVAGRSLLYPRDGDAENAVLRASGIVRPTAHASQKGTP